MRRRGREIFSCAGSPFGDAKFRVREGRTKWFVYYPQILVSRHLRPKPRCGVQVFEREPSGHSEPGTTDMEGPQLSF